MAVNQFKRFLEANNLDVEVIETEQATRTAEEAATVHGVPVSNIVKSLLVDFGGLYRLFLTPGDRRLDLDQIKRDFEASSIQMASADDVKNITGYSIGGVPPFGHKNHVETHIVDGFDKGSSLVAAAGSGNSVFKVSFEQLSEIISKPE